MTEVTITLSLDRAKELHSFLSEWLSKQKQEELNTMLVDAILETMSQTPHD